jgi:hypothetical protein
MQAASYSSLKDSAMHVWDLLYQTPGKLQGLVPVYIKAKTEKPEFVNEKIAMGGLADSVYEYMLKQYILDGKKNPKLLQLYTDAMRGMRNLLVGTTAEDGTKPWIDTRVRYVRGFHLLGFVFLCFIALFLSCSLILGVWLDSPMKWLQMHGYHVQAQTNR